MTPALSSLIAPMAVDEFLDRLRSRTRTLIRSADRDRLRSLIDATTLDFLIGTAYPVAKMRMMRESMPVPEAFYLKEGRVDPIALMKLLDQGLSVILNEIDEYVPQLRALCRDVAALTGDHSSAEAVLTTGKGGALRLHYDPEDILVLQIAGTKRWRIYDATVRNPVRGLPKLTPPAGDPVFDEVLDAGDVLFVPGGQWHHCENGVGRSLHVSILMYAPYGRDLLTTLASAWLDDPVYRRPLTRHANAADLAAHEAVLKTMLIDRINQLSLADFLAARAARRAETARFRSAGSRD